MSEQGDIWHEVALLAIGLISAISTGAAGIVSWVVKSHSDRLQTLERTTQSRDDADSDREEWREELESFSLKMEEQRSRTDALFVSARERTDVQHQKLYDHVSQQNSEIGKRLDRIIERLPAIQQRVSDV